MILSIIAALDANRGIGLDNQLPWHLPADLSKFKQITMGHHLIVGRKTYLSIGKQLPGRTMIVLSRNPEFQLEDSLTAVSLTQAIEIAQNRGEDEAFVIGGGEIYRQALPLTDRMYLSRVDGRFEVDTYFPDWQEEEWDLVCGQSFAPDERNSIPFEFQYLIRKKN